MPSRFLTQFGGRGLLGRDPFLDLHREVNRLFDDSFRSMRDNGGGGAGLLSPKVDVCQTSDGWEISAELPGVEEKDIDIRLDGDVLTISGEKRDGRKDDQNRFVERSYGSFARSFQLPFTPDPNQVTADAANGVLTIKVPKTAEQDRSTRISIGSSGTKMIDAGVSNEPAIGKGWSKEATGSELPKEQADKDQSAPA